MNAAIITKVTVSKTTGQTKLYAICQAKKIRVPWDHELNTAANHIQAAKQLAKQVEWFGKFYGGGMPDNSGYCFVQATSFYHDLDTGSIYNRSISIAFNTEEN